eukprot:TRINITY_DN29131_c0_g1_i1.p1 TRINITY_DN29131_c0_g1~~TRINITY_DN29131_c0_g1_i1.p1  ORF type:complete len:286 (+),score=49.42 TRINITY_DN29131_c0_g1_i1:95-952(+)
MDRQIEQLEARLSQGLWSSPLCLKGRGSPGLPQHGTPGRSSKATLPPLDASLSPSLPSSRPASPARVSPGHLGVLQSMRRSQPTLALDWPSAHMRDGLLAPLEAGTTLERPAQQDLRIRRQRRPADLGASLRGDARNRSSRSCAELDAGTSCTAQPVVNVPSCPSRCASVPPTGTAKADKEASSMTKAGAVAALQQLFFEEMASCGGGDANGAAARALRRLMEATPKSEGTHAAAAEGAGPTAPAGGLSQQLAALGERPAKPRCPSPVQGRQRRPCPGVRVAVRG